MSIDPKKGGKCWSCKYCEDIATQDNNPSGAYYRKCSKSGKEYIDTCSFYCADYVWDGEHSENMSSSSYSSSSKTSSSQESEKGGCFSTAGGCLMTLLVIGAINAVVGGLIWFIFSVIMGG